LLHGKRKRHNNRTRERAPTITCLGGGKENCAVPEKKPRPLPGKVLIENPGKKRTMEVEGGCIDVFSARGEKGVADRKVCAERTPAKEKKKKRFDAERKWQLCQKSPSALMQKKVWGSWGRGKKESENFGQGKKTVSSIGKTPKRKKRRRTVPREKEA